MNCPNCGAYIGEKDLFCGECGRPVDGAPATGQPLRPEEVKDLPTEVLDTAPSAPSAPAIPAPAPGIPAAAPTATGRAPRGLVLGLVGAAAGVLCLCIAGVGIWLAMDGGEPTPTAVAVAVNPVSGMVIYEDDFEDPDSGWDVYNYGDTLALYQDGEYRLGIFQTDYVAWGNPDSALDLGDFEIEADARAVEGPLDNNLGILVRYQDGDEGFYWFQISSDGFFAVDRLDGDEWIAISEWQESAAIQQGLGATNRLRVTCVGEQFTFYVNDTWLTTVSDDALDGGRIGLAAGSFDEPGVVVHFDNVRVYGPGK
jgi:hypothetical protein